MEKWIAQNTSDSVPDTEKLARRVSREIKDLILSGKVQVGQRLPSGRRLSEQFHVSRVVVREALKRLEQSGLVEIRIGARGGAYVTRNSHLPLFSSFQDLLNMGDLTVEHIIEVRRTNECANVRLACAKATAEDIERLRWLNRVPAGEEFNSLRVREDNINFHLAIAEISGNPLAKTIIHSLVLFTDILYPTAMNSEEFMKKIYERHEAIINAIEARDVVSCELMMAFDTEATKLLSRREDK